LANNNNSNNPDVPPATATSPTSGIVFFTGLKNLEYITNACSNGTGYYDGCKGSLGSGPGPNLGLEFSTNAQAIVSAAKGGSGNFTGNPNGNPVMFSNSYNYVIINVKNGVDVGLWFWYSALQMGQVTVYDGANATGNVLFNSNLSPNNSGCNTYKMCVWTPVGIPLTPIANSIQFSGTADYFAIADIHLGKPLPSTTTVTSNQDPTKPCGSAVYTASIHGIGGAIPANSQNGLVKFRTPAGILADNVPVVNGAASLTETLPSGTTVTAIFKPTVSFGGSSGSMLVACQ
jgi:hypothetical protein